jgi:RimJ/RimL family protein N-acetyltransferase
MPFPLETRRLVLREIAAPDWRAIDAYNRDPRFHRYLPIEPPDAAATQGFVRLCLLRARERPRRHFDAVVVERASGEVLGTLRLSLRGRRAADLGYAIRPDRWNEGFASEAVARLLAALRLRLALAEVWATVDAANAASIRVMMKLGFDCQPGERGRPIKPGRPASLVFVQRFAQVSGAEQAA